MRRRSARKGGVVETSRDARPRRRRLREEHHHDGVARGPRQQAQRRRRGPRRRGATDRVRRRAHRSCGRSMIATAWPEMGRPEMASTATARGRRRGLAAEAARAETARRDPRDGELKAVAPGCGTSDERIKESRRRYTLSRMDRSDEGAIRRTTLPNEIDRTIRAY